MVIVVFSGQPSTNNQPGLTGVIKSLSVPRCIHYSIAWCFFIYQLAISTPLVYQIYSSTAESARRIHFLTVDSTPLIRCSNTALCLFCFFLNCVNLDSFTYSSYKMFPTPRRILILMTHILPCNI